MPEDSKPKTPPAEDPGKAESTKAPTAKDDSSADEGQLSGDVADQVNEANAKGYVGTVTDPEPNSAHSMESGPDSPPAVPDHRTRIAQPGPS